MIKAVPATPLLGKFLTTRPMGREGRAAALSLTLIFLALAGLGARASGQEELYPREVLDYPVHSGFHSGSGDVEQGLRLAFETRVVVPGAPWMWLRFADFDLGSESSVTFFSELDGAYQVVDATNRARPWGGRSAALNGESVLVQLWVAPRDREVFLDLAHVVAALPPSDEPPAGDSESLCGTDDRIASANNRVGRLFYGGCTAYRITNGAFLTAGHCADFDPDLGGPELPDGVLDLDGHVEFNVPASSSSGNTVAAHPDDQYPIDTSSVVWRFDGSGLGNGKDWAVFEVFPNENTGLMPHEAYGLPYRVTREEPTAGVDTIRITGFGVDTEPTKTMTNQTNAGSYLGEFTGGAATDLYHEYRVDTDGANSGSPIIWTSNELVIGVHTNAGCSTTAGNKGTSFEVNALESALNHFFAANVEHVDQGHPLPVTETGSVYRPWDTVAEGVNDSVSGGLVSIVTGTYNEGAQTITKAVTLDAPCGSVVVR